MAREEEYALGKTTLDYSIWLNDPKKGEKLNEMNITRIDMGSKMFMLLPTLNIMYNDNTKKFAAERFKIGQLVYITMAPKQAGVVDDKKAYVSGRYRIMSINVGPSTTGENAVYSLQCVYDAVKAIAEVKEYPENQLIVLNKAESSDSAIKGAMEGTPLSVASDVQGADTMIWMNSKLSRKKFIEKIALHSWLGDNDAPVLYTNFNGECTYTSLDKMCEGNYVAQYVNQKNFTEQDDKSNCIIYDSVSVFNPGGLLSNNGGYSHASYLFDTNNELLNSDDNFSPNDGPANLEEIKSVVMGNEPLWSNLPIVYKYNPNQKQRLGNIFVKDDSISEGDINVKTDVGLAFPDLHPHYDVAPGHNISLLKSFFQIYVMLTVNINLQVDMAFEKNRLPRIGQKIFIDFKQEQTVNKIYTGNYIIAAINLTYQNSNQLTAKLICVSDGVYCD